MLVQAQVFPWQEPLSASNTPMPSGREACDPSPDTAPHDPEVERQAG